MMSKELFDSLINSDKIQQSDEWDLLYENLPVVFAEDTKSLQLALDRLDEVGGYGYVATWRKNFSTYFRRKYY